MSPQEQLALRKAGVGSDPDGTELRAGAGASKQRSPGGPGEPGTAAGGGASAGVMPAPPREHVADGQRVPPRIVREYLVGEAAWTTRVVRSAGEFETLADRWNRLLPECADANVFVSHEWLYSWWAAYRPSARLAIVLAEDRGQLRGIAPMMIETVNRAGLSMRVLRFIGDGTGESDHVNFLAARSERALVLNRLLDAIGTLEWDLAEFNQIPEHSDNAAELLRWIERNRLRCRCTSSPCPVRRLPPTEEAVLAALPGRLRTSIRSSRKKLQQRHRVEFGAARAPGRTPRRARDVLREPRKPLARQGAGRGVRESRPARVLRAPDTAPAAAGVAPLLLPEARRPSGRAAVLLRAG